MKPQQKNMPAQYIAVNDMRIELQRKRIRNLHIRVYLPDGAVRVSAPLRIREQAVRAFIESRMDWIRKQQQRIQTQPRPPAFTYTNGEAHYVSGRPYVLRVRESSGRSGARLTEDAVLELWVPPGSDALNRGKVLERWYRTRLYESLPGLTAKWEQTIGVRAREYRVKRMRTLWGSCSINARRIWLNLELARRQPSCLEYVLVHEMVHLLERYHNARFYRYMDSFLPDWRARKSALTGDRQ